jgi:hypothetical protein
MLCNVPKFHTSTKYLLNAKKLACIWLSLTPTLQPHQQGYRILEEQPNSSAIELWHNSLHPDIEGSGILKV